MRICTRYAIYLRRMDAELAEITSGAELDRFCKRWMTPIQKIRQKLEAAPVLRLWLDREHVMTVNRLAEDAKSKADEWKAVEEILAGEIA